MLKNSKKVILGIVPLTKIPLTTHQSFSYLWGEELPAGTLVSAPLFHRKVEGVVLGSRKDFERLGNIELKKIEKVLEENFLTTEQIKLAEFLSAHYFSPLGIVLKSFVPHRVKARRTTPPSRVRDTSPEYRRGSHCIVLTTEQKEAVKKIAKSKGKSLLFGPSGSGKTEVYIHSILEIRKKKKDAQFLILIPEKTLLPQALERYGAYFPAEEIATLSSTVSKGQFYLNWQKIKSGEARIIIGTRSAIFAPFKKLRLIVVDEGQDMSYKNWDMNPRYDAREAAEKLARIFKCAVVRGSATPTVETYWRAQNKEMELLELPRFTHPQPSPEYRRGGITHTEIVDMKKERWAKNYSCISKKLKAEIAYALKNGQQTLILINRQGMSAFSICDSCKTVLKCPKCERALIYERTGHYKCAHCAFQTGITPKCEKCGGLVFKNVGLGTQKVAKEIENIFSSARIIIADASASREKNFHEKIYADFSSHKANILIGTQMISKGWDLPRVSLVGIIDTDNMLSFPDFSTQEKFYGLIVQVSGRVARPGAKFPGTVVLQTYQPENKIIRFAAEKNYTGFYANEIEERKALNFPPFTRLIRLTFQDYDFKKTEKESARVWEILKEIASFKVTEPHAPLIDNIRGRFRRQIVVKVKKDMLPKKLAQELEKLPSGWIIDVDPISII